MGYRIRILGAEDPDLHINELVDSLKTDGLSAGIAFDLTERPNKWTVLDISNVEEELIAQLQRNPVSKGSAGAEEIAALKKDIQKCKPSSAVKWLKNYFEKIPVVYTFHLLDIAFEENNAEIIGSIKTRIWDRIGGIVQADNQGFSNEDGYHILWQFSDDVSGEWDCAVLNSQEKWETFTMDLGDAIQRKEFMAGKVPANAKRT